MTQLLNHYKMAAAFAYSLQAYCASRGVELAALASKNAIDTHSFQDNKIFIGLGNFVALMEDLAAEADDDCFGLGFGMYFKLGDSGPFGFGLMNAPNLAAAIRFFRRFALLTADYCHVETMIGPDQTHVQWRYSPLITETTQYTDMMAVILLRQFRLYGGAGWQPSLVRLMRGKPRAPHAHRDLLAPHITYASDMNEIVFASESLDFENPHADIRLFSIMEETCGDALRLRHDAQPLELRMRSAMLQRLATDTFSLPELAKQFGMSDRNLQRQLQESGATYEALLDQTRRELTDQLFKSQSLSLEEIADRLGYKSQAAFSRFVKKWYGAPPSVARSRICNP
jgi:AraC-like DNA-binding protein